MAQRLPISGSDDGTWGDVLNGFLEVSLASDGTLNSSVVGTTQIVDNAVTNAQLDNSTQTILAAVADKYVLPNGGIPSSDLATSVQTSLNHANTAAQTVNSISPDNSGNVSISASSLNAIPSSQLGASSGVAQLDSTGKLKTAQVPGSLLSVSSQLGNISGSATITSTTQDSLAVGTLTGNTALTTAGLEAGWTLTIALFQDSTGNRSLTINSSTVAINLTAESLTMIAIKFDGTDSYVAVLNSGINSINGKVGSSVTLAASDVGAASAATALTATSLPGASGYIPISTGLSSNAITWIQNSGGSGGGGSTAESIALAAFKVGGWQPDPRVVQATAQTPTEGVLMGTLLGFPSGSTVNNLGAVLLTAGSGSPSSGGGIWYALVSSTGTVLAITNDVSPSLTGHQVVIEPVTSPYTFSADSVAYICIAGVGMSGWTTQPQFARNSTTSGALLQSSWGAGSQAFIFSASGLTGAPSGSYSNAGNSLEYVVGWS
jgi:hypothetical protein